MQMSELRHLAHTAEDWKISTASDSLYRSMTSCTACTDPEVALRE